MLSLSTDLESVPASEGQIYVVAPAELGLSGAAAVLSLSPLFTCPELEVVEGHFSHITADQLFALEVVSSWQKRYEQERQGYLNRPCSFTSLPSVPESLSTAFGSEPRSPPRTVDRCFRKSRLRTSTCCGLACYGGFPRCVSF